MAYTTIDDPTIYFNTKLYTGNGGTQSISGVGFQPDWVWIKNRSGTDVHALYDSVRGANKNLRSDATSAEGSQSDGLTSFDSDGFSVGAAGSVNTSSNNFVSWNWLASGSTASNSDGSITSTVSANTTVGFSIVSYTGNGTTNATVGHGLGVTPSSIWFKRRDSSNNWINYFSTLGTGHYLTLNLNGAKDSASGAWCTPSSTTFQLNQVFSATNTNTATYIAYCFAEKQGYSKIGSYTGNANADGPMLYTGFRPAWFLVKNTAASEHWRIYDNKRNTFNHMFRLLNPNENSAESTVDNASEEIDFLSNGVKIRSSAAQLNGSGQTLIYMAFAESPFVNSNGIPNNAR
jgi:hypothetical protein